MTITEMPQFITILSNVGFPIAITIYLFIRFERKLEKLEESIHHLGETAKNSGRNE